MTGRRAPDALFSAWANAAAFCAFMLLFAGGMVTSTGSGLSVPDWPTSFGGMNPPMIGGIFYEHGHRLFAGATALLVLGLAAVARRPSVPSEARAAAWAAAAAVLVQALLGGLTVLLRLPPAVSISHACLGQGVFCLLLAAAVLGSRSYATLPPAGRAAGAFPLAAAGFAAAFLQLALGALIRHAGASVGWHAAWSLAVLALAAGAVAAAWRAAGPLRSPAATLALVLPLQLGLGLFAWRLRLDSTLDLGFRTAALWRTTHLSGGAATLAAFLRLALLARRAEALA